MKIRAIITGSTGMVGKAVLLECLNNDNVESVLVVNRRSLGMTHTKLREVLVKDFFDLSSIENELTGYNACYFCLGVTSAGKSEKDYTWLTYDLTIHFARTLIQKSKDITFCYVSGAGTDSTEKGKVMWARVKGKTENEILNLGFKDAYMFRPGFIQPMDGIRSSTKLYNFFYIVLWPLFPLIRQFKGMATTSRKLSKAMINVVLNGYNTKHIESRDIDVLSRI